MNLSAAALQLDWCCRLIPSTIWIWNSWCFMRGRGIRETWFPQLYYPRERRFLGKDVAGVLISFLLVCMCTTKTTDRRICCDSRAAGWRTGSLCVAMKLRVQGNSILRTDTKTSICTSRECWWKPDAGLCECAALLQEVFTSSATPAEILCYKLLNVNSCKSTKALASK